MLINDTFQTAVAEIVEESKKANRLDKQRAEELERLILQPGWKVYTEILNAIIDGRGLAVLAPAGSVDGAMALEYEKGTMSGLIRARDLPSFIINAMKPNSGEGASNA